jgi:hypothetical protein
MMSFVVDKVNEKKENGPNANWMQEQLKKSQESSNCSIL